MTPHTPPRGLARSPGTSAENVENVVSPPQKPVTTSNRHSGATVENQAKKAIPTPIT
jgi:hypothetical protein